MHCDVISMIFTYYSKLNFSRKKTDNELLYKRSYQPILSYLYTEVKKRRGKISLHEHFKYMQMTQNESNLIFYSLLVYWLFKTMR